MSLIVKRIIFKATVVKNVKNVKKNFVKMLNDFNFRMGRTGLSHS